MLLARIYLNSRVQTNTLRTDYSALTLPSEPLTMPKYSPSSNTGMASLQEEVSSPWTARVCSSHQPTYTERCSQTECEQPVRKGFIGSRTDHITTHTWLHAGTTGSLESGDYRLSHVRDPGRAARLGTKC